MLIQLVDCDLVDSTMVIDFAFTLSCFLSELTKGGVDIKGG